MMNAIYKGIKSVSARDLGREMALAAAAGVVSALAAWYVSEKLKQRQEAAQGQNRGF